MLGLSARCLGFLIAACATAHADVAQITVDPAKILAPVSPYLTGVCMEDVNHEIYGGIYSQMIFGESFQEPEGAPGAGVSKWWKPLMIGDVRGGYALTKDQPFVGAQSQRMTLNGNAGSIGLANRGLNGQGMSFVAGQDYRGELWVRTKGPADLQLSATDSSGANICASTVLHASGGDWKRLSFTLTPKTTDPRGSFAIVLQTPGTVDLGYASLEPGEWGRFHDLPERRDVAEKMIKLGTTVVRYGGSMVNAPEYRWKNMTGPRAKRPPYKGTWYPFSSNGWGIPDFCAFTDAAGFLGIPAFNMGETPQDIADFLEYAHGGPGTKWGAQRIADGNKKPFKVHVIELGNEEKVDDDYWKKFEPIARAIWSKDPKMILTVGDFHYDKVITDPFHFTGGAVDTLASHQKILALAKAYGAEVWFDVHLNTQGLGDVATIDPLLSYIHALGRLANGAKFHVVTYELNANTHDVNRALLNACMIGKIERAGAEPVVTSANALQVDGQNDNGWNQGLIFMNPEKVWVQPPGYVMQMIAHNRLANVVKADCNNPNLDVTATMSTNGKTVTLQVVNFGATPVETKIDLPKHMVIPGRADQWTLTGELAAVNTAADRKKISPGYSTWIFPWWGGSAQDSGSRCTFPPHSFSIVRLH